MSDSLFCPNCGMLKKNCVCGKYVADRTKKPYVKKEKKNKGNYFSNPNNSKSSSSINNKSKGVKGLYQYENRKPITVSEEPDVPSAEIYDIAEHDLPQEVIDRLKEEYPEIPEQIIENFPFEQPREGQLEIIADIEEAISKGYKYIILEAGTGTGKSAIASTLARMYESAYILTMTKQLQNQYADEFDFPLVKGRGNFDCLKDGFEVTCDMGACKTAPKSAKFFCPYGISKNPTLTGDLAFQDSFGSDVFFQTNDHCKYWQQKANAINSPITLMNYDYAILELNYVKHFGKRSLLILDEAHNIEDKLMRTMEINLYNRQLEKDIKKVISPQTLKRRLLKPILKRNLEIG